MNNILRISPALLLDMLRSGTVIVTPEGKQCEILEGVPEDAEAINGLTLEVAFKSKVEWNDVLIRAKPEENRRRPTR